MRNGWLRMTLMMLALPVCQPGEDAARPNGTGNPAALLLAEPARLHLGAVPPKSRHERRIALRNLSAAPVEVKKLDCSCPCVTLELPKRQWEPGETITALLKVDLKDEPADFRGGLALTVTALTLNGSVAFEVRCEVDVND